MYVVNCETYTCYFDYNIDLYHTHVPEPLHINHMNIHHDIQCHQFEAIDVTTQFVLIKFLNYWFLNIAFKSSISDCIQSKFNVHSNPVVVIQVDRTWMSALAFYNQW